MKSLFKNYTYTLALAGLVAIISLLFSLNINPEKMDEYLSVTLKETDNVSTIVEQYNTGELTKRQFIDWIEENNRVYANTLEPGDTIVIPVSQNHEVIKVASRD
ncbi:hypothetical protein MHI18_19710 [Peribacillus sp. FSL H8-0477]|uniref:cell division suppressor protein YneA n=1 Tax=Peribacillus sp. FSL H8-0477 TaxID=2921388 RepID=UPI0030F6FFD7